MRSPTIVSALVVPALGASALAILVLPACSPPREAAAPPSTASAPAAPAVAPPSCLSIVAWNDLHGQLGPDDPTVDTGRVPAGGVVGLADEVAAVRATGDAVVVLDAGDLFTGPLGTTMAEGAPVIEAYRVLGVDAAAIGNHEFDFGPVGYERLTAAPGVGDEAGAAGPRGALLERMASASFPFLAANVTKTGGAPTGWPNHKASTHVARGGFDVGVVGYTTNDTPTTTLALNVVGLEFANHAAERVAAEVRALRAAGSSPVVLLAHASIEGALPQSIADAEPHHGEIATLLERLGPDVPDLVVGGHRHAWAVGKVRGVPFVTSDQHGVGLARVRFCRSGAAVKLAEVERRTTISAGPPRTELGAAVAAVIAPWEAKAKPIADAPVATIGKECTARSLNGGALADQIARAIAKHVGEAAAPPAGVPVVGLVNAGALRAPLTPGVVRYGDVFTTFPFENSVAACGTTRAGLLRILENGLKKEAARERMPFGIAGAKLELRRGADLRPTVVSLTIDGQKKGAPDDAPVWVALPDFLLLGGDALLAGVTCTPSAASQTRIREAWRQLLAAEAACDGPSPNIKVQ